MGTTHRTLHRHPASIAILAVLAFLLVANPAPAGDLGVSVTARIAPVFELTMLTDGAVDFGTLVIGRQYESPDVQRFRVRSTRPWDFTDSSDTVITVGGRAIPRDALVRHAVSPGFGPSQPQGVREFDIRYTVDLTTPEALDLPADTTISTRFGYTCVQQ